MSAPNSRGRCTPARLSVLSLALAAALASTQARADLSGPLFSVDVSALGLSGAAFTANAFKAVEVSHITFLDAMGNWSEHGIAKFTGILNGGTFSTPTGMNSTYTLFMDFQGTGNIAAQTFYNATETLYLSAGAATFGLDANHDAWVDTGGNTVWTLATSTLQHGTTSPPVGDLYADLLGTFERTADGALVFNSPNPFYGQWFGHFFHSMSDGGAAPIFGANGLEGFAFNGGDDTLVFVPEPGTLLLTIAAMAGLTGAARRRALPV